MRWLLHGSMSSAVADALRRHEQTTNNMLESGLPPEASPAEVLDFAAQAQLEIITTDAAFAQSPFLLEKRLPGRCMVYLQLAGGEVEQDDAVDRLFARYKRLTPGRLYTVTGSRVKVRQLPGGK